MIGSSSFDEEVARAMPGLSAVPILIVDDNPAKRLALTAVLSPLGYSIVEADSGRAALRCVMDQSFAVILLDVRMPDMDGFETAGMIRERRESEMTPIIFITAYSSDEIAPAARYVEGAVDFMFAPVLPAELRAKVSVFANLFMKAEVLALQARDVRRSADQLRLLTDAAPIGIFQVDAEGRSVYSNPRWSELTGIPMEEARGQAWASVVETGGRKGQILPLPPNPSDAPEICQRFEISSPHGPKRIILMTTQPIPDPDGGHMGWVGTVADVTAEVDAETAMSYARDQANEASQIKSDFLANMSHEIRTPMNGVIGMVDLLLETDLDDQQRGYARIVRDSGVAMLDIIGDILDFSKVEAGKLEIENLEYDVRGTLSDLVDLLEGPCNDKDLTLESDIHDSVPATVVGDAGRVRQVLTNLIGNAIKFTHSGRIAVTASRVYDDDPGVLLRFSVTDSGVGIAEGDLETIFQPFTQAARSTFREYGGTGLGLAISGRLIALMGGDRGVTSRLGIGSTFWFTVRVGTPTSAVADLIAPDRTLDAERPLHHEPLAVAASDSQPSTPSADPPPMILLAEDGEVNRKVATAMLEKLGYGVDVVVDGRKAVEAALNTSYRAILMDCQMPGLDGYEATAEIRRRQGASDRTPIIALTAGAMESDRDRCIAAGMNDHLSKPLRLKALEDLLRRWVPDGRRHTVDLGQVNETQRSVVRGTDGERPSILDPVILDRLETLGGTTGSNLITEVAALFVSDSDARLSALRQALEADDGETIAMAAHTLGGAGANLGATELASLCATLENEWTASDPAARESMFAAICHEMTRVVDDLDVLIATP